MIDSISVLPTIEASIVIPLQDAWSDLVIPSPRSYRRLTH